MQPLPNKINLILNPRPPPLRRLAQRPCAPSPEPHDRERSVRVSEDLAPGVFFRGEDGQDRLRDKRRSTKQDHAEECEWENEVPCREPWVRVEVSLGGDAAEGFGGAGGRGGEDEAAEDADVEDSEGVLLD